MLGWQIRAGFFKYMLAIYDFEAFHGKFMHMLSYLHEIPYFITIFVKNVPITYTKSRYVSETQHVDVICTLSFDRYVLVLDTYLQIRHVDKAKNSCYRHYVLIPSKMDSVC